MSALNVSPMNRKKRANVSAEVINVNPKTAEQWLTRNVRNRKLKPGSVAAYARDMAAGRWQLTGQPIIFDTNGALSDGQNRLHAVIKSGATVSMMVVSGVDPETQAVMDSGVKRSVSDALVLDGTPHPMIMSAAARLALSDPEAGYGAEAGVAKANVTHAEALEWIEEQGENLINAAGLAAHYYPNIDIPPSVLCIAWMRLSAISLDDAGEFFSTIADCQTNGVGDPRSTLIKRLSNARRDRERLSQRDYLSMFFRAWNAWRAGERLHKLPTNSRTGRVGVPTPA